MRQCQLFETAVVTIVFSTVFRKKTVDNDRARNVFKIGGGVRTAGGLAYLNVILQRKHGRNG